jgi:hypothetical protein
MLYMLVISLHLRAFVLLSPTDLTIAAGYFQRAEKQGQAALLTQTPDEARVMRVLQDDPWAAALMRQIAELGLTA